MMKERYLVLVRRGVEGVQRENEYVMGTSCGFMDTTG
jgi:hypothetical protein